MNKSFTAVVYEMEEKPRTAVSFYHHPPKCLKHNNKRLLALLMQKPIMFSSFTLNQFSHSLVCYFISFLFNSFALEASMNMGFVCYIPIIQELGTSLCFKHS